MGNLIMIGFIILRVWSVLQLRCMREWGNFWYLPDDDVELNMPFSTFPVKNGTSDYKHKNNLINVTYLVPVFSE